MPGNPSSVAQGQRLVSGWNRIARRTRWLSLFYNSPPKISVRAGSVSIAPSASRYVWASAGTALGIALFAANADARWWLPLLPMWALRHLPKLFFHPQWHFDAVGLIIAGLAALSCARVSRIVLDGATAPARLQIVQGIRPFAICLWAGVDELSLQLTVGDEKAWYKGHLALSLAHVGAEFLPIRLALAEPADSKPRELYACLAQWIKAEDLTTVSLSQPEGAEIIAPKTPVSAIGSRPGRGSYRLAFSDADHLAFLPTAFQRYWPVFVFLGAFTANAFVVMCSYVESVDHGRLSVSAVISLAIFLAITLVVMLVSQAVSVSRYIVASDRKKLVIRKRRPWRNCSKCYPVDGFAAVQICFGLGGNSIDYELNLLLRAPAGERVPIVCYGDVFALRADAAQLAQFLGVPLIDNTRSPAGQTSPRSCGSRECAGW